MNNRIILSAALFAAVGLTGCDSRYSNYGQPNDVTSGTTTAAPNEDLAADLDTGHNNRLGSGYEKKADLRETNEAREERMRARNVAPTYDETRRAEAVAPVVAPTSGSTSNDNVYVEDAISDDEMIEDDTALSGSTSEPVDDMKTSYSQTDLPGGMTAEDRNLRYGLIGNGTGMGLEDTTSKAMTDNQTMSDPTFSNSNLISTGALSAPTDDQDALKDIKSGTSFDPENYYIEED